MAPLKEGNHIVQGGLLVPSQNIITMRFLFNIYQLWQIFNIIYTKFIEVKQTFLAHPVGICLGMLRKKIQ